jgi:hypothetical protein
VDPKAGHNSLEKIKILALAGFKPQTFQPVA